MVEVIERYGLNLKRPSYHKFQVSLLKKEMDYTNDLLKGKKKGMSKTCLFYYVRWMDK